MDLKDIEFLLRSHDRQKKTAEPFRFSTGVNQVSAYPKILGLDFDGMMACKTSQERVQLFLHQQECASVLRRLLAGESLDDAAMRSAFGISFQQLEDYRKSLDPVKKPIPRRLVVLCFDDSLRDQFEYARPLLKQYGFGATFFITEKEASPMGPAFSDKSVYMDWDQIAALEADGFEIGNHSLHHTFGAHEKGYAFNFAEFKDMEADLLAHGLTRPVSCAYPSGICNRDTYQAALDMGYRWGRGNNESGSYGMRGMTYYDPRFDSPLSMCNFGDPDFYTEELLEQRIDGAGPDQIFGLTYHSVSESGWPGPIPFRRHLEIMRSMGCTVIPVRALEEYVDPEKALAYTEAFQ